MTLLTVSASVYGLKPRCDDNLCHPTGLQTTVFFIGLYLIALGTGGIKPCVSSFGARPVWRCWWSREEKEELFLQLVLFVDQHRGSHCRFCACLDTNKLLSWVSSPAHACIGTRGLEGVPSHAYLKSSLLPSGNFEQMCRQTSLFFMRLWTRNLPSKEAASFIIHNNYGKFSL